MALASSHLVLASSALGFAILFNAIMFSAGHAQGWYRWPNTYLPAGRFLAEPTVTHQAAHPEDIGWGRTGATASGRWYYWRVPPSDVTAVGRATMWLFYSFHQIAIWALIYHAQSSKAIYQDNLHRFNWIALGVNVFFHLLHLVSTHVTYDGLAQDVSVASSQGSVIMLLVFVMLMEYQDRGLFFGFPGMTSGKWSDRLRLSFDPGRYVRCYHGYAFSWAAIYTFWYHPCEPTIGHCLGFVHTWLIMLQGSLMLTPAHLNRYWRLLLECYVVLHSGVVAFETQSNGFWAMFVFGFLMILLFTQIFILPLWRRLPGWTRFLPFLVYVVVIFGGYSALDASYLQMLGEIVRIPAIEYAFFAYAFLVLKFFARVTKATPVVTANMRAAAQAKAAAATAQVNGNDKQHDGSDDGGASHDGKGEEGGKGTNGADTTVPAVLNGVSHEKEAAAEVEKGTNAVDATVPAMVVNGGDGGGECTAEATNAAVSGGDGGGEHSTEATTNGGRNAADPEAAYGANPQPLASDSAPSPGEENGKSQAATIENNGATALAPTFAKMPTAGEEEAKKSASISRRVGMASLFLSIYAAMIFISFLLQYCDVQVDLILLMAVCVAIFIVGCAGGFLVVDSALKSGC